MAHPEIPQEIQTFVKNRMTLAPPSPSLWIILRNALKFLQENGTARDVHLSAIGLTKCANPESESTREEGEVCKNRLALVTGPVFRMEWKTVVLKKYVWRYAIPRT